MPTKFHVGKRRGWVCVHRSDQKWGWQIDNAEEQMWVEYVAQDHVEAATNGEGKSALQKEKRTNDRLIKRWKLRAFDTGRGRHQNSIV